MDIVLGLVFVAIVFVLGLLIGFEWGRNPVTFSGEKIIALQKEIIASYKETVQRYENLNSINDRIIALQHQLIDSLKGKVS